MLALLEHEPHQISLASSTKHIKNETSISTISRTIPLNGINRTQRPLLKKTDLIRHKSVSARRLQHLSVLWWKIKRKEDNCRPIFSRFQFRSSFSALYSFPQWHGSIFLHALICDQCVMMAFTLSICTKFNPNCIIYIAHLLTWIMIL